MKETTGWKKENPGSKKENPGSKKAREAGAFSGNRNSAPGRNAAKSKAPAAGKSAAPAKSAATDWRAAKSKAPVGNAAAKQKPSRQASAAKCPHFGKCGGCQYLHLSYEEQLAAKKHQVKELMEKHCKVRPIIGMDENPWHYRHKVQAVFGLDRKKQQISGVYEEKTHRILPVETCLIEDQKADAIIATVRSLLKSFKIKVYDEDTGYGLLRYVLIRKAEFTDEIMVVLVTASPVFPSKRNFVEALRREHPEITTVVQNVNDRTDSLVLGSKYQVLWGKGYIVDRLCGCSFKISPGSFYQVNPIQAQKLYEKAIELADLTGKETVVDAYCGTGTIGMIAAKKAGKVFGVESNPDAVRDAVGNAKANDVKNIRFYREDAGHFLQSCAADNMPVDVVLMDPPRAGSSEEFLDAVAKIGPKRVVYVSCNPTTLERDCTYLEKQGYRAKEVWPVDMFPWSGAVETVVLLSHKKADSYIHIDVEFGEGEGKIPVDSIAKRAEAYKPKEKVTYKMIKEYIEAKYGFKVHTAYIAEVKRDLGLPMYDAPNAVEELKQPRKHPTPEKVEAIKDALRYFAVI